MTKVKKQLRKKRKKKQSTQKPLKTRRNSSKYGALDPKLNLKSRADLLDFDYLDKLNDEELAFLSKFVEETVHASLDYDNLENNLYATTPEKKQECSKMNNDRNNDVFVVSKTKNLLDGLEKIYNYKEGEEDREETGVRGTSLRKRKRTPSNL